MPRSGRPLLWRRLSRIAACLIALAAFAAERGAEADDPRSANADSWKVDLGAAGALHFYTARPVSGAAPNPESMVSALVVIHGYPRDVLRVLDAGALAAKLALRDADTLVAAPLFQVTPSSAERCHYPGTPAAEPGYAVWTCSSWIDGGNADGGGPTSFEAMDALVAQLVHQWPRLQTITLAGFSAGAQFVQHYAAFARPPAGLRLTYVVSDPGSWLYFTRGGPRR